MVRRRVGLTVMLALLIIGVLLSVLPWHAGAIRLAGVSVTWWYAVALAPGVAVLVRLIVGTPAPVRALASWVAPALFVSVAMQIFVAAPAAPLVALAAILAPMMAGCVRARAAGSLPRFLAVGILSAAGTLVACANFLVATDLARGVGLERWHGLLLAAPIALVLAWRGGSRWRQPVLVGSVGLLAIAVVAVAVATGVTPWRAWTRLASRPVVAFDESSVWVTQGRTLSTPTSVTLTEAQRMTATSIAMWRVVPGDDGDGSALEWRLVPGDSLALRSGDQVLLPAGAGVRFESGRRVPGAPISGVAWADATASSALDGLLAAAGAVVTLVGGGLTLLASPSASKTSVRSHVALLATASVVIVAVCWGVYAADVGADLALGVPAATAFMRLPSVAVSGAWGGALEVVTAVAITGLLMTAVTTLADRVADAWSIGSTRHASVLRAAVVTAGALVALVPTTAWNALMLGLGLAAAGLGPTLVDAPPPLRLMASVTGAVAVVSLALADPWLSPIAPALSAYPALLAIPLAAGAGWMAAARQR